MQKFHFYFTSDTHGHIFPSDYASGRHDDRCLANLAADIRKDGNTLVLDGGDTLQGTPLMQYYLAHRSAYALHPAAAAFNAMQLDYFTLGNHDFNFGYDTLREYLTAMQARCLCANVEDLGGELPIAKTAVHTLENGLRIGLVGVVTDWVNVWEQPANLKKLRVTDAFAAAKTALETLRGRCDMMVLMYHGGFEEDLQTGEMLSDSGENNACRIARELDYDLLLTGHQHIPQDGVHLGHSWAVQPPANAAAYIEGSAVRQADRWTFESRLVVPGSISMEPLYSELEPQEKATQHWLDEPICRVAEPIPPEEKLDAALHGSKVAELFNEVQRQAAGTDFSCTSLTNDALGLPARLTMRHVLTLCPFSNTLVTLEVTPGVLRQALERCAACYDLQNGMPVISARFLKPKVEHYNYDFYAGLAYTFDLRRPIGQRVVRLTKADGTPLKDKTYTLCVSNYRATGTGGYSMLRDCRVLHTGADDVVDLLCRYLRSHDPLQIPNNSDMKVFF